jgi:hypothetical protein
MPTPRQRVLRTNDCSFAKRRNRRLHFFSVQRKDQLASQIIRGCGCRSTAPGGSDDKRSIRFRLLGCECPDDLPLHDVIELACRERGRESELHQRTKIELGVPAPSSKGWWSQTGSNRRPPACKAGALPTELWPRVPKNRAARKMVGLGRFELPTSRLSSARSNQLSYKPQALKARDAPAAPMKERRRLVRDEERETKTAVSRIIRPDWPAFVPKVIR